MTFGSIFSWVCLVMSQWRILSQSFCFCYKCSSVHSSSLGVFIATVKKLYFAKHQWCYQFSSIYVSISLSSAPANQPVLVWQLKSSTRRRLVSPGNSAPDILNAILADAFARWGNVAVAPIMNFVIRLSISAALVLLASHRQEPSQQQSARWKCVTAALLSSRLSSHQEDQCVQSSLQFCVVSFCRSPISRPSCYMDPDLWQTQGPLSAPAYAVFLFKKKAYAVSFYVFLPLCLPGGSGSGFLPL